MSRLREANDDTTDEPSSPGFTDQQITTLHAMLQEQRDELALLMGICERCARHLDDLKFKKCDLIYDKMHQIKIQNYSYCGGSSHRYRIISLVL